MSRLDGRPRPLFVLLSADQSNLEGTILKLDEDGTTYRPVCKGLYADMADMVDYLDAGEVALHGPR